MLQGYNYKPVRFFLITYLVTWISWFLAAYFSYQKNGESIYVILMVPGLVAPFGVALWMIMASKSRELKKGFVNKLTNFKFINPSSIPPMLLIMPVCVVLSILISVLFGQSIGQLKFAEGFSFSVGVVPVLLVLILAASFEELGWRSYAMDSLSSKFNYFMATLIFALLWAFWHLPLFFIKDYYQNEIFRANPWFGINFMVSIIPIAFIISWLCRKNKGSILVAIFFHFFINMGQEALHMEQIAKCIETVLLFVVAAVIIIMNKKMFFEKEQRQNGS